MPQSIQSQILGSVVALLATAGQAFTTPVLAYRLRVEDFGPADLPAWNVIPEDGLAAPGYSGATARKLTFHIRNMVAAANQADLAADPLYVASSQAILADLTLGGLATSIREIAQKWERDGFASQDNLALVVSYEVEFATARTDPSIQVP